MRFLLSGGCKNGKSTLALALALAQGNGRAYIATMKPSDDEDRSRIQRHRSEREGLGFETIEQGEQIEKITGCVPQGTSLVIDSATALLVNEMFPPDGKMDSGAAERVTQGLLKVLDAFSNVVLVSDSIYSDALRYDMATEAFRKSLARVDCVLARHMDGVVELSMGNPVLHKGDGSVKAMIAQAAGSFSP